MIINNQTIWILGFSIGSFLIGLMVGSNLKPSENTDNRNGSGGSNLKPSENTDNRNRSGAPQIKPGTKI